MAEHERPEDIRPESYSASGQPMVPATPRDIVYIRIGSFILIFLIALGAISMVAGAFVLSIAAGVLAVVTVVAIVLAVRRQRWRGSGEAG